MRAALAVGVLLAGCAAQEPATRPTTSRAGQIGEAVTAPLADLNLVTAPIPQVLSDAVKNPYAPPADLSCDTISLLVQEIDAVMGPDLDQPADATHPGLVARGTTAAGDAAVRALRGAAEGLVPYRGWVRRLSGAERYSRQVAAAIAAGTVRRAYLKGLGQSQACAPPAAPMMDN